MSGTTLNKTAKDLNARIVFLESRASTLSAEIDSIWVLPARTEVLIPVTKETPLTVQSLNARLIAIESRYGTLAGHIRATTTNSYEDWHKKGTSGVSSNAEPLQQPKESSFATTNTNIDIFPTPAAELEDGEMLEVTVKPIIIRDPWASILSRRNESRDDAESDSDMDLETDDEGTLLCSQIMSTTSISATASEIYRRILFLEAHAQVLSDQIDSISPVPTPDAPKMGLVALDPTTLVNLKADLVKLEHGFRFLTKDVAAELPGTLREALADSLMLQTIVSGDTETEAPRVHWWDEHRDSYVIQSDSDVQPGYGSDSDESFQPGQSLWNDTFSDAEDVNLSDDNDNSVRESESEMEMDSEEEEEREVEVSPIRMTRKQKQKKLQELLKEKRRIKTVLKHPKRICWPFNFGKEDCEHDICFRHICAMCHTDDHSLKKCSKRGVAFKKRNGGRVCTKWFVKVVSMI
ncbi:hypothetical protein HDU79_010396 [Rhizoclosmatium sp. JEL0117]|nr:hypothetical protein HDU79_010396 [Rhizoclosmatium sp. JEL0117]